METNCVITAYARDKDGYGTVTIAGTKQKHHRLVYCKANNLDIDSIKGKIVMHTCDNPSCVNPNHLVLGTHADNTQDMWRKDRHNVPDFAGVKNPKAKLTEDDVRAIRKLGRTGDAVKIGKQFGVSKGTVYYIVSRRTWQHVTD